MNNKNEIYSYNIYEQKKVFLGRFINSIDSISWDKTSKHLFLLQNEDLLICDLEFTNCKKFLEVPRNDNFINNSKISQFVFARDNAFEVYNLDEIF